MFACLGAYPVENSMVVVKEISLALIASLTRLSDNRGPNCHPLSAIIMKQGALAAAYLKRSGPARDGGQNSSAQIVVSHCGPRLASTASG